MSLDYDVALAQSLDYDIASSAVSVDYDIAMPSSSAVSIDYDVASPASLDMDIATSASMDCDIYNPASLDYDVGPFTAASLDLDISLPASLDYDVGPFTAASLDFDIVAGPFSPFYAIGIGRHVDSSAAIPITVSLNAGVVLPANVTVSLMLQTLSGMIWSAQAASFSSPIVLSNAAPIWSGTMTTAAFGRAYLIPSHIGYAVFATPAPAVSYIHAAFTAPQDGLLDFTSTSLPSGTSGTMEFTADFTASPGALADYVAVSRPVYDTSTGQTTYTPLLTFPATGTVGMGGGPLFGAVNATGSVTYLPDEDQFGGRARVTFTPCWREADQNYILYDRVIFPVYHDNPYSSTVTNTGGAQYVTVALLANLSGSFQVDIEYEELVAFGAITNSNAAGPNAEPYASKNYAAYTPYGYDYSWSSSWSSNYDTADGRAPDYEAQQQLSGSVPYGRIALLLDQYGNVYDGSGNWYQSPVAAGGFARSPIGASPGTGPFSTAYTYPYAAPFFVTANGAGPVSTFYPSAIAPVSVGVTGDGGSAAASGIAFGEAGAWSPLSYSGTSTPLPSSDYTPGSSAGSVGVGSVSGTSTGVNGALNIGATAGAETSIPLSINIYDGEKLATQDYYFMFGNSAPNTNFPTSGVSNAQNNITYLTAHRGQLRATIPQIFSQYPNNPRGFYAGGKQWVPDFPANRNDYRPNALVEIPAIPLPGMSVGSFAYDYPCLFLDEIVYPITTLLHAALVVLESFGTVSNWTVTNGSKGSDGSLLVTASAAGCTATTATSYNKDCRHYRYIRFNVNATSAQGALTFVFTDKLGVHKTWISPALTNGANVIEFDLCHPQMPGTSGTTRTVWDVSPGALYGVQNVDQLQISGFAVGNAVTISAISLFRKNAPVKGRVQNEMMPNGFAHLETEWYPPDVPVTGGASVDPTVLDGWEDTIVGLTNTTVAHKLYGRQIAARVDGKFAIDVPHAVQTYPFLQMDGVSLWEQVLNRDRLSVNGAIAKMSGIPGLSFTPTQGHGPTKTDPATGLQVPVYSGRMPAVYLTVSDGINAASLDTDLNGMQILAQPLYNTITGYAGQTLHLAHNVLKRHKGSIEGLVVNTSGGSAQGIAVSLTPYNPFGTPSSVQVVTADADGYYRFTFAGLGPYIASTNLASAQGLLHQRAWRWLSLTGSTPVAGGGCLEIDSVRGWLYLGLQNQIAALHLSDYQQVFVSTPYSVDSWRALRFDGRCATLVMLGINGSGSSKTFSVWRSQDGGLTATEVASVTANSSAIERDSPNGLFAWFYETGEPHTIMVRFSKDGGLTYGSAVTCQYNSADLQAIILDVKQDDRNGSLMIMLCQQGGNTLILQSKSKGLDWTLQLSA